MDNNKIVNKNDISNYSPMAMAFLGDAVYGLLVREKLVLECNRPAGALHTLSIKQVNAAAQAKGAKKLLSVLTQEESDVFKRGRNTHTKHTPKNQSEGDYHYATGLETLFGYLHLLGEEKRLRELFEIINGDEVLNSETGSDKD